MKLPNMKFITEQSKLSQKDLDEYGSCTHKHFVKGVIRRNPTGICQKMRCVHCGHQWDEWRTSGGPETTVPRTRVPQALRSGSQFPTAREWEGV